MTDERLEEEVLAVRLKRIVGLFLQHVTGESPIFVAASMHEDGKIELFFSINKSTTLISKRVDVLSEEIRLHLLEAATCNEKRQADSKTEEKCPQTSN